MGSQFSDIDKARRLLGLDDYATLEEIRNAFHRIAKKMHPDANMQISEQAKKEFQEISWAYEVLMSYCKNYRYSFREEDVQKQVWDKETYRHLKQFYDGWWGNI